MLAACSSDEVKDQSMAPVESRSADAAAQAAAEKAAADKAANAELAAQAQAANNPSVANGALGDPRLGDGKMGANGKTMGANGKMGVGGKPGSGQHGGANQPGGGQYGSGLPGDGNLVDANQADGKMKGGKHLDPRLKDPNNILSKRSVYYDLDKYDVKDEFKPMVEAHAKYLTGNADANVIVQGNCDERGSREYNVALGHRRAESVRKMMNVLGVPDKQIETVSFGEEKPRATCHEESCWSENRRSDIMYQGE